MYCPWKPGFLQPPGRTEGPDRRQPGGEAPLFPQSENYRSVCPGAEVSSFTISMFIYFYSEYTEIA